jgi:hypothetical protein
MGKNKLTQQDKSVTTHRQKPGIQRLSMRTQTMRKTKSLTTTSQTSDALIKQVVKNHHLTTQQFSRRDRTRVTTHIKNE